MLLAILYSLHFLLEQLNLHVTQTKNPDKEITFCAITMNSRNGHLGSILEYLETKAFKIVGLKLIQIQPFATLNQLLGEFSSAQEVPTAVIAIQGKDSVAMVHNYIKNSGLLVTKCKISHRTASPIFCPSTEAEARDALCRLFQPGELHDWERSADWWIVRENC